MKAVYYCRVSTDEENQINALGSQIVEAENCIKSKKWVLVDKYVDEGKSGTSTKKRDEYKRLCDDLTTSKFDIIVIKSQDRLMRNTKEWYVFIDMLVSNNKKLFFYLDNKFYTPDDALITGIKAILAEEYSRELSKKINNAHKNRQENGKSILITSATWGYDKVGEEVVINEKEAEVVKLIYDLCIQGYGSRSISKELTNRNIKSRSGNDFPEITIRKIIRNPLFKGTAVMNKTHIDFNTKKTTRNPKSEWKIHENAVPAIVPEDIWNKANKIMDSRSKTVKSDITGEKRIGVNQGKYDLSSKIICGECGAIYWRRYRRRYKNEEEIIVEWSCSTYIKRGRKTKNLNDNRVKNKVKIQNEGVGCDNIHIKENDLVNVLSEIGQRIFGDRKEIITEYSTKILSDIIGDSDIQNDKKIIKDEKERIINQKNFLLDKLLDGVISDKDYKRRDSELENELNKIKDKEALLRERELSIENVQERLEDIKITLNKLDVSPASVPALIKHVTKIVVFPTYLEIYFDFYENIKINIVSESNKKKYQYVESGEYLASIHNQESQSRLCNQKLTYDDTYKR